MLRKNKLTVGIERQVAGSNSLLVIGSGPGALTADYQAGKQE
jgi:hypothetical protein